MVSGDFGEPRLIHSPGFIQLCTDKSNEPSEWAFLSSGIDGDVWLWGKEDLDEADYTPKNVGGRTHSAIAWHGLYAYIGHTYTDLRTGVEKAVVSKMDLENTALSPSITSFSLDVTTVDVSASGDLLAAGSMDHVVKLINLKDDVFSRLELEGQVLCVGLDPKEEYVASSASDGKLYVYRLPAENNATPIFTTRLCSRITDIDISQSRLQLSWSPDGNFLFAPFLGGVKQFMRVFDAESKSLTTEESLNETFSICCASSCGRFVAASALSGLIVVWNVSDSSVISSSRYVRDGVSKIISSMIWHPALENTIVIVDVEEHMCALSNCTRGLLFEEKKKKMVIDESDDNDTRISADLGAIKKAYGFNEDGSFSDDIIGTRIDSKSLIARLEAEKMQPYQPPCVPKAFTSGATPQHLPERYLKWNRFGVITAYVSDTDNSIEVSWHDASIHPVMNIDNASNGYVIGDMSNDVVALASKENSDGASELYVIYIAAWDQSSREWKNLMTLGESIEDVAVGGDFIAVATSCRCFRTFSLSGTQRLVISFTGFLCTMCASQEELALATYNGGYCFEDGNDLPQFSVTVHIYKIDHRSWHQLASLNEAIPLPLSPGAQLLWMGFSKGGEVCALDSKYCLRLLTRNRVWMPIYDFSGTLKTKSDSVWIISVVEKPGPEIRYFYCKGTAYPIVATRPVPLILKWQTPLCNPGTEKTQLEGNLLLTEILRSSFVIQNSSSFSEEIQELSAKYAKDVVRLFALACKADRECRAAELAWLAPTSQVLQSLCNFAAKTRHPLLSEKVADIGRQSNEALMVNSLSASSQSITDSSIRRSVKLLKKSERKSAACDPSSQEQEETIGENSEDSNADVVSKNSVSSLSLDLSLVSERSYRTPLEKIKSANPFKRKSVDVTPSASENLFDSLATPEYRSSPLSSLNASKKPKHMEPTSKQSLLSFSSQKACKEVKSGFELWLSSSEGELKKQYDGDEKDFLKFATKTFRSLSRFEKQKWNDAAGTD